MNLAASKTARTSDRSELDRGRVTPYSGGVWQCIAVLLLCVWMWQLSPADCSAQFGRRSHDMLAMYLFNGADEATFRKQLERSTQLRIERIANVVELDEAQRAKLELANHGDLCRFYREIDQVRQKVKGLDPQNNEDLQAAWVHIAPLQQRLSEGVINENSLSERILRNLLDDQQQAQYQRALEDRRMAQRRALVRVSISELEQSLPLTVKQREGLIKLLDAAPLADNQFANEQMKAFEGYALMAQLAEEELSELLDEQQRLTLDKLIAPYKRFFR